MNLLSEATEKELKELVYTTQLKAIEDWKQQHLKSNRYKTETEAAEYCGVSVGTLRKWHKTLGLKRTTIDQTTRYDIKELDKFMSVHAI